MLSQPRFSDVTKDYLCRYYAILDNMIAEMTEADVTNSISHDFVVQMIPHHMAAIEMSKNILKYTTCLPLQEIASNIITSQTKSIENMHMALHRCGELQNALQDVCLYQREFQQITKVMFSQMRGARSTNHINANFLREMIPHHQGAIRMSENALRFEICPELIPILQAIITSQRKGVKEMERLLQCI